MCFWIIEMVWCKVYAASLMFAHNWFRISSDMLKSLREASVFCFPKQQPLNPNTLKHQILKTESRNRCVPPGFILWWQAYNIVWRCYLEVGEPRVWSESVKAVALCCFVWLSSKVRLSRSQYVPVSGLDPKAEATTYAKCHMPCRHCAFKKLGFVRRGNLVPLITRQFGFSHTQPKKCFHALSRTHIGFGWFGEMPKQWTTYVDEHR